jgi:hypothetical protein
MRSNSDKDTELLFEKGSLCCLAIEQIEQIMSKLHLISGTYWCNNHILEMEGCPSL